MKKQLENSIIKTYRKDIWSKFMKALREYALIQSDDVIAVCISGGKDSMLMAKCFAILSRFTEVPFTVKYIVMDPGYKQENLEKIKSNAKKLEIPIEIFSTQIFETVEKIDKNPCYLCARMRRGYLYNYAQKLGCNKIALGHHYDDVIETNLMNIFYAGEIRTMMPKLHSQNFKGMELIRPLYLVKEDAIIRWKEWNDLDFLECACRFTEENDSNLKEQTSKRKEIKDLIKKYKEINPYLDSNIFHSMANVNISKVLSYYDEEKEVNFLDTYDSKES
ncbi:tRNA 2-thiocytidine biosynthesis protein TtcA [Breznakia sp. PF5-3]|uniref:tRNA lysidine(34) synthetase n=1 Tax=unclassified Breznakia TaxID=2623764 RepID=UPI002405BC62|nr:MULTISPECIES: tRNA 2-thiocytidine biosynthesis TtcA family protein [unclassified Breznakia]MDF9824023.1 tRNA 2-thiocytidine biosynthesis protein TtcA [Breznakia sp. PM6-1]MDF9834822.1 tRNA 2-thiocytidine biosynthesis protein TtcA [Breznakia sp. PF5-3]MDF9838141.1 tRNA 2-thiocytidine biosynthesis protein TtcA [Breznakia sp. PFB2-8]MDF9860127.1 tRNA 2-thiocytidine biosynthesis protein TtcA [Breznakia sp. PH5-24]